MKRHQPTAAIGREEMLQIFSQIDTQLATHQQRMSVTVIGGVSIILLGLRERSTRDIDIAPGPDAEAFRRLCASRKLSVDIVTIATTVDFAHAGTVPLFRGEAFAVNSVTTEDLIKLKLERFRKQDPEDIYAIIEKTALPYDRYCNLVRDMLVDFIGNPRELALSALVVVEQVYPDRREHFRASLGKTVSK